MKLDLLVYGRGTARDDGFQLFASPSYWTEQMLLAMAAFNELWVHGDLSSSETEAYSVYTNPWGHTYMFIAMPKPFCCALLRCTRVEDNNGNWLKEVRNYDVWSMEGLCCQYEDKEMFWAMLPSIILWMEDNNVSFYRRLMDNTIERSVEIPDKYLFNPFNESVMGEEMLSLMGNDTAKNAMVNLCNYIHYSNGPSHMIFGPLAECFSSTIGNNYAIVKSFSTIKDEELQIKDPFEKIQYIARQKVQEYSAEYKLRLRFGRHNESVTNRCWELAEINDKEPSLFSGVTPIDNEKGIDMMDLYSEAEAIVLFTRRLGLTQPDIDGSMGTRYDFKKE